MPKSGLLLLVDDDPLVLEALYQTFIDDYEIILAKSGIDAIEKLQGNDKVDTIVLDIRMAQMDGLQTASRLKEINSYVPIIFHTGYPGDYSEELIENNYQPFDYIGKNERPARLIRAVKNAVSYYQLQSSDVELIKLAKEDYKIIGKSYKMLDVYKKIEKISALHNKVMILGDTGTGKELVAKAIHKKSNRADKPLAFFNCNYKSADIVESELFGHIKGSFTGAISDRVGIFEYADKGTLFLDEIGDLDIRTQAKILRVLECGELSRIGSPDTIKVDVRLICATHQNLEQMVEEKEFRRDLFYRLKGITINLPRLIDRREDIPLLIDHFSQDYCQKNNLTLKLFEPQARELLLDYDWPGNVRPLSDSVTALIDLSPSYFITKKDVEDYLQCVSDENKSDDTYSAHMKAYKRKLILKSLDKHNDNVSASARELSLDPSNLRKLIKELDIKR